MLLLAAVVGTVVAAEPRLLVLGDVQMNADVKGVKAHADVVRDATIAELTALGFSIETEAQRKGAKVRPRPAFGFVFAQATRILGRWRVDLRVVDNTPNKVMIAGGQGEASSDAQLREAATRAARTAAERLNARP